MPDSREVASCRCELPRETWWRWSSRRLYVLGMLRLRLSPKVAKFPTNYHGATRNFNFPLAVHPAPRPNRMPGHNQTILSSPGHTPTATFGYYSGSPTLGNRTKPCLRCPQGTPQPLGKQTARPVSNIATIR